MSTLLIYGYGNPGRQDDGVGPALVAGLEEWRRPERLNPELRTAKAEQQTSNIEHRTSNAEHRTVNAGHQGLGITLDANYQLNAEVALAVAEHDEVIGKLGLDRATFIAGSYAGMLAPGSGLE